MNSQKTDTTQGPSLPPSPLAEVVAAPADVPLPWSTPLLAAPLGLLSGVIMPLPPLHWLRPGGPHTNSPDLVLRAIGPAVVVLGAVVADRAAPACPKPLRWAAGMAVAGALCVGGAAWVLCCAPFRARNVVFGAACLILWTVLSDMAFGSAVGFASGAKRDRVWKVALVGASTGGAIAVLGPPVGLALARLIVGGSLLPFWPSHDIVPAMIAGLLLGLVLVDRLQAARRRAMAVTEVVPVPPDTPLPWTTPALGVVAGALAGITHALAVSSTPIEPLAVWMFGTTTAVTGGLFLLGPTIFDRVMDESPRPTRWAVGMALGALVPVVVMLGLVISFGALALLPAGWTWAFRLVLPVVVGGVLGWLLGQAANLTPGLLWKLPMVGASVLCLISVTERISFIYSIFRTTGVPFGLLPQYHAVVAHGVLGLLLGLALAERLHRARRRAIEGVP